MKTRGAADELDAGDTFGLLVPRYKIAMREDAPLTPHVIERIYEKLENMRYDWATMMNDADHLSDTTRYWFAYLSGAIADAPLTVAKPKWIWAERPKAPGK